MHGKAGIAGVEGSPEKPLIEARFGAKLRDCARSAVRPLSNASVDAVIAAGDAVGCAGAAVAAAPNTSIRLSFSDNSARRQTATTISRVAGSLTTSGRALRFVSLGRPLSPEVARSHKSTGNLFECVVPQPLGKPARGFLRLGTGNARSADDPISATQPSCWKRLFLPHTCRSHYPTEPAQVGGEPFIPSRRPRCFRRWPKRVMGGAERLIAASLNVNVINHRRSSRMIRASTERCITTTI